MASERPEPEVRGGRAQRWVPRSEGEGPAAGRGRGLLRVRGRRASPKPRQLYLLTRTFLGGLEKELVAVLFAEISSTTPTLGLSGSLTS